jgi:hypothetical protein
VQEQIGGIEAVIPGALAGALVFAAAFVVLGGVGSRDRDRLRELRARLRRRGAPALQSAVPPEPAA